MRRSAKWMLLVSILAGLAVACSPKCPTPKGAATALQPILPKGSDVTAVRTVKEISGLCETVVTLNKKPVILYLDRTGQYVLSGSLFEIATKKNLTQERIQVLTK